MSEDAGAVIKRHILKTREARSFHRKRKDAPKLNLTESGIAALKVMWLADLLREITGEVVPRRELDKDP